MVRGVWALGFGVWRSVTSKLCMSAQNLQRQAAMPVSMKSNQTPEDSPQKTSTRTPKSKRTAVRILDFGLYASTLHPDTPKP